MSIDKTQVTRWRLILGQHAQESLSKMAGPGGCQLSGEQAGMDEALAAIYDESAGEGTDGGRRGQRSAGLGPSAPNLAKWLGDIRTYFKEDVVTVIQNDAIEKKGLTQLLFEPDHSVLYLQCHRARADKSDQQRGRQQNPFKAIQRKSGYFPAVDRPAKINKHHGQNKKMKWRQQFGVIRKILFSHESTPVPIVAN